jgi:hypothetical protein
VRRIVAAAAAASVAVLPAGCALPHHKDINDRSKLAITPAASASVLSTYNNVRAQADAHWSPSTLASAEAAPLLRIDAGRYLVSFRLNPDRTLETAPLRDPVLVASPRFDRYPMWFMTEVPLPASDVSKVALFVREGTTTPWKMVYGPEIAGTATLPALRTDDQGAAIQVSPDDANGVVTSPAQASADYANLLDTGSTQLSREFVPDAFLRRMLAVQDSQTKLTYIGFHQSWSVRPVRYALRLENGGVLAFATLVRTDRYRVEPGGYLQWPGNADASAYLPNGVTQTARLRYYHQIVMKIPPTGDGKVAVIGHYGGVVSGKGS